MVIFLKVILFVVPALFVFFDNKPLETLFDTEPKVVISGTVSDKDTGKPLPFVHVYLSHTTTGTTTDDHGKFLFETNLSGEHELVFSFIGYRTQTEEIRLTGDEQSIEFNIKMEPRPLELEPLEVQASNEEWLKKYQEFRRNFLGTNRYARETEINNYWVLDFEQGDDGSIKASSVQPLEVENFALGYTIHIDLVDYSWERTGDGGMYTFYSRFEEMEPENRRQQRTWQRNRERVYRGSFEHFLKSLFDDELGGNRFETVFPDSDNYVSIERLSSLHVRRLTGQNPGTGDDVTLKGFRLRHPVDVLYGSRPGLQDTRARSGLVPMRDSGIFLVTKHGRLYDPLSVRLDGEWSYHRVANLLPINYSDGD